HQGRRDEYPRQDADADLGWQALDQRARAREEEPDPADSNEERNGGEQELGEELIALPVPQRLGPDGVSEEVVDRGEDVLPALRVDQDPDAEAGQDQPDQADDQQQSRSTVRARDLRALHRHLAPARKMPE